MQRRRQINLIRPTKGDVRKITPHGEYNINQLSSAELSEFARIGKGSSANDARRKLWRERMREYRRTCSRSVYQNQKDLARIHYYKYRKQILLYTKFRRLFPFMSSRHYGEILYSVQTGKSKYYEEIPAPSLSYLDVGLKRWLLKEKIEPSIPAHRSAL